MRHNLKQLLLLATLLSLAASSGFWGGMYWEGNRDIPFNRALWKAGSINQTIGGDVDPFRHKMVKDLLEKYLSAGMNRGQVVALLGEPSESEQNTERNEISYWLNQEYGWGIDPVKVEELVIKFNSTGSVEKVTRRVQRK